MRDFIGDGLKCLAAAHLLPHRWRPALLRRAGVSVPSSVLIYGGLTFNGTAQITIGADVFINVGCHLDAQAAIHVAAGVRIADHVRIVTSSHALGPSDRRAGQGTSAPVEVGAGAWLCSGAVVLPGVIVAPGCVIAAGAVVTASTLPDGLYAGVPARRIRDLPRDTPT